MQTATGTGQLEAVVDVAEWTFMVYMAGDNNLSDAGDVDLAEMQSVGSSELVNVVVEFDNAGDEGTRRFRVGSHGALENVETCGETDSGDPETVISFLEWAAARFPARRYGLVLWNHGSGWAPNEIDRIAREVRAPGYSPREISERSSSGLGRVLFRSTHERIFSLPDASVRAICSDDGSGHSLDMIELERVLERGLAALGQPLDLLGMDACLMSTIEVACQVRRHTRWIVASEESEPNNGWPYDRVLRRLQDDPAAPTEALAAGIVHDFIDSYLDVGFTGDVTQTAMATSRIAPLAAAMAGLARHLTDHMPAAANELWQAQRSSAHFWHNTLWDIRELCLRLAAGTASELVRAAANRVRSEIESRSGAFVTAEAHAGAGVDECGGVSVYAAPPLVEISRYYSELAWAREVPEWLEMLGAYHAS